MTFGIRPEVFFHTKHTKSYQEYVDFMCFFTLTFKLNIIHASIVKIVPLFPVL